MAASEGVFLERAIVDIINGRVIGKNRYSQKIRKQADECVAHILKFSGSQPVKAWHSDNAKNPAGKRISAKPNPKTDIVLKIGNNVYYTSVKMSGPVQLASGQGASTADLFEAAAAQLGNNTKCKVLNSIINEIRVMPTRMMSNANVIKITESASEKLINEFIVKGKIITDKHYDFWLQNNKATLMASLLEYVDSNKQFKLAIINESLTGKITLKQYKGASANSIISPKGFHIIDDAFVNKIYNKVKFDIRGKTNGNITGLTFRIDLAA